MTVKAGGTKVVIRVCDDTKFETDVSVETDVKNLLKYMAGKLDIPYEDQKYFGLSFMDDREQQHWLQPMNKVLDYYYPKTSCLSYCTLYYHFQFFPASVLLLRCHTSVELLFLELLQRLSQDYDLLHSPIFHDVAALAVRGLVSPEEEGGNTSGEEAAHTLCHQLTRLAGPSTSAEPEGVRRSYEKQGEVGTGPPLDRVGAVIGFIRELESRVHYGMHTYPVRDRSGSEWVIGVSGTGIHKFSPSDLAVPVQSFPWRQLQNIYYRSDKFSIEVNEVRRLTQTLSQVNMMESVDSSSRLMHPSSSLNHMGNKGSGEDDLTDALLADPTTQFSQSRRVRQPLKLAVHSFYAPSPLQCKSVWQMAIAQHQFFLQQADRPLPTATGPSDLMVSALTGSKRLTKFAALLCQTGDKDLHNATILSSDGSLFAQDDSAQVTEHIEQCQTRKATLEERMSRLRAELKELCIRESELTGELPVEIHGALTPGESVPDVRKRVGTAFKVSAFLTDQPKSQLSELESAVEVQKKIARAFWKLANDPAVDKRILKDRRATYNKTNQKLRLMENKLHKLRSEQAAKHISALTTGIDRKPSNLSDRTASSPSASVFRTPRMQKRLHQQHPPLPAHPPPSGPPRRSCSHENLHSALLAPTIVNSNYYAPFNGCHGPGPRPGKSVHDLRYGYDTNPLYETVDSIGLRRPLPSGHSHPHNQSNNTVYNNSAYAVVSSDKQPPAPSADNQSSSPSTSSSHASGGSQHSYSPSPGAERRRNLGGDGGAGNGTCAPVPANNNFATGLRQSGAGGVGSDSAPQLVRWPSASKGVVVVGNTNYAQPFANGSQNLTTNVDPVSRLQNSTANNGQSSSRTDYVYQRSVGCWSSQPSATTTAGQALRTMSNVNMIHQPAYEPPNLHRSSQPIRLKQHPSPQGGSGAGVTHHSATGRITVPHALHNGGQPSDNSIPPPPLKYGSLDRGVLKQRLQLRSNLGVGQQHRLVNNMVYSPSVVVTVPSNANRQRQRQIDHGLASSADYAVIPEENCAVGGLM